MITLLNNKFVKNPKVSPTGSFGRGYGVFETLRTFDKELPLLKKHIDRLFLSAKKIDLKIKYTKVEIKKMVQKIAKKSPHKIQRIKIMATEEDLLIFSVPAKINNKIYQGISLLSTNLERSLPEIKSISYLPSYLAHERAAKKGHFDALLINKQNKITEGAYSNIFWFEKNTLCTPNKNILPGITREIIIKNSSFKIKFKDTTLQQLKKKKEIFITQSVNLIVPVLKIDQTQIAKEPGEKTKKVMEEFKNYLLRLKK